MTPYTRAVWSGPALLTPAAAAATLKSCDQGRVSHSCSGDPHLVRMVPPRLLLLLLLSIAVSSSTASEKTQASKETNRSQRQIHFNFPILNRLFGHGHSDDNGDRWTADRGRFWKFKKSSQGWQHDHRGPGSDCSCGRWRNRAWGGCNWHTKAADLQKEKNMERMCVISLCGLFSYFGIWNYGSLLTFGFVILNTFLRLVLLPW